jgi:site-specific DNA-methyltransferase (adenine-specific)
VRLDLFNGDAEEVLGKFPDNCIDMSIQSPPYDNLRNYSNTNDQWNFDKFKSIAKQLYSVMKNGSVTVWIVNDATIDGGRTLTTFKQAIYFQEIGFKVHDVMIWQKPNSAHPSPRNGKRYSGIYEYMLILVKGKKIRQDITLIADKKNKYFNKGGSWGKLTDRKNGNDELVDMGKGKLKEVPEFSLRNNIWLCNLANVDPLSKKYKHPAAFSLPLCRDHILSWSVEGDTVLDCFMGGATSGVAALQNKRNYIGIELLDTYYNDIAKPRLYEYMSDVDVMEEGNYNLFTNLS